MIGCKRSILKDSQARLWQGSPMCEQLCGQIVQQSENSVSQTAKIWKFHPLQSIILSKPISGKAVTPHMSLHWKIPMDFSTWALDYFGQPLSVSASTSASWDSTMQRANQMSTSRNTNLIPIKCICLPFCRSFFQGIPGREAKETVTVKNTIKKLKETDNSTNI